MIVVHQAIYGDLKGAYTLLGSSFSNSDIPRKLGNHTDLIDRPQNGVLAMPIIRGFSVENFFLLVKSFPDTREGVRRGRVFSHALIMEVNDVLKIQDITQLLAFHLKALDTEVELGAIEFEENLVNNAHKIAGEGRMAAAINGLVAHSEHENTIVWEGEMGYFDLIGRIWSKLPDPVKTQVVIGVAFDPQRVKKDSLNLIYTPEECSQNWINLTYKLIGEESNESINTQSGHFLVGNFEKANDLKKLIDDFQISINEIDDLLVLESYTEIAQLKKKGRDLKKMVVLMDLISLYNPNPNSAKEAKERLLQVLSSEIQTAKIDEIAVLGNPNFSGFDKFDETLKKGLNKWLDSNLYTKIKSKEKTSIVVLAFDKDEENWWASTIRENLTKTIRQWKTDMSVCVWDWIIFSPKLIPQLESILSERASADMARTIPKKLPEETSQMILEIAQQRKWLLLHGLIAIEFKTTENAFKSHLKIDTEESNVTVLKEMSLKIHDDSFIPFVVKQNDNRLISIAAKRLKNNPKLLEKVDPTNLGWQQLWLAAITLGMDVWKGVTNPQKVLFEIFDLLMTGGVCNEKLLERISLSSMSNALEYQDRRELWDQLPEPSRTHFLSATVNSILRNPLSSVKIGDLEDPIVSQVQKPGALLNIFKDQKISNSIKIELLEGIKQVDQKSVIELIKQCNFSRIESKLLGSVVKKKNWKNVADFLYSIRHERRDAKDALEECSNLLGVLKRIEITISTKKRGLFSQDEWWNALTEWAVKHYPTGPTSNGIWETAGGDNADLYLNTTGKKAWFEAIRFIRNGGRPTAGKLIETMLDEFPFDKTLQSLKKTL